jgi:hypothetical protein
MRMASVLYPRYRWITASILSLVVLSAAVTIKNDTVRNLAPPAAQWSSAHAPSRSMAVLKDSSTPTWQSSPARLLAAYGKLPLSFEINHGQTDPQVKFLSRGSGYSLFLTADEAELSFRKAAPGWKETRGHGGPPVVNNGRFQAVGGASLPAKPARLGISTTNTESVVHMRLVGANPNAKISGIEELPGRSNYFVGKDPSKWRTNVPNYARVKYENVYSRVDLVYYGNQHQLEYDFLIQPKGDPHQIRLALESQSLRRSSRPLKVDYNGDLVVGADGEEIRFRKPVVYQATIEHRLRNEERTDTNRHFVDGKYVLSGDQVTFEVASYDKTKPLIIDPTLAYSTYLGGSDEEGAEDIAVDTSGNAYVTGFSGIEEAFVTKLNPTGTALVYSTHVSGGFDNGIAIAVDHSGNAYITGWTGSSSFPTTPDAFRTSFPGSGISAFVTKLNPSGSSLLYSTYLGVGEGDGIAVNSQGNAYVTGSTGGSDFPVTPGAFQTLPPGDGDAFVTMLNPTGSALVYSTYLGGTGGDSGIGIAVDASGSAYVAGFTTSTDFPTSKDAFQTTYHKVGVCNGPCTDGFITKLNPAGSNVSYSTYLGGSAGDRALGIAIDAAGDAYVTGDTTSYDFPTTPEAFQTHLSGSTNAFVSKLNPTGSGLLYSTFLAGTGGSSFTAIAVDISGHAFITGSAGPGFPTTPDAFQTTFIGSAEDSAEVFVTKLDGSGSALLYSTYLGGSGSTDDGTGIVTDASGGIYITGQTFSSDFPTTPGAFQTTFGGLRNAFVSKFSFCAQPKVKSDCKNGGWRNFCEPSFKNQGQCVAFVNHQ